MNEIPVHQVLFRLAARAPTLSLEALMDRLTTGLANHYGAVSCTIHTDRSGWASSKAEPIGAVQALQRLDRARLETVEARLVTEAVAQRRMQTALDLEKSDEIEAFLNRTMGVIDIFAFPLIFQAKVRAVLVLYLSLDSEPVRDADMHGLMAAGELLALAGEAIDAE